MEATGITGAYFGLGIAAGRIARPIPVGALVSWWDEAADEIRTVAEQGFAELLDGWIDTIRDVIEDCKLEIGRLENEKTAFEQQGDDEGEADVGEGEGEGNRLNYPTSRMPS